VGQVVYTARLDLPTGGPGVRFGREAARLLLRGWGVTDDDLLDRVELVVSELVSNAVRHTEGASTLELSLDTTSVTAAVTDSNPEHPAVREAAYAGGGRGLPIVDDMSSSWGSEPAPGGKRVWARFDNDGDHIR
jgi:anti-sigma regulatory factor (Ser/Thr protein kinase)